MVDVIEGIKKMFPHTAVDITVQTAAETEYMLSNPAYARELEDSVAEYEMKSIRLKAGELLES